MLSELEAIYGCKDCYCECIRVHHKTELNSHQYWLVAATNRFALNFCSAEAAKERIENQCFRFSVFDSFLFAALLCARVCGRMAAVSLHANKTARKKKL